MSQQCSEDPILIDVCTQDLSHWTRCQRAYSSQKAQCCQMQEGGCWEGNRHSLGPMPRTLPPDRPTEPPPPSVRNARQQTSSQPATRRYSKSGVRPAAYSCPAVANCLPSDGFWESAAPYGTLPTCLTTVPLHTHRRTPLKIPLKHLSLCSRRGLQSYTSSSAGGAS